MDEDTIERRIAVTEIEKALIVESVWGKSVNESKAVALFAQGYLFVKIEEPRHNCGAGPGAATNE